MAIDLILLSKKNFITLKELDGLLFHSLEILQNKIKGSLGRSFRKEAAILKQVLFEFEELVVDALEARKLKYVDWRYNDSPFNGGHFVKFEKDVIFAWLLKKNILAWLQGKGVEVPKEVIELIESYQKREPETDSELTPGEPEPTAEGGDKLETESTEADEKPQKKAIKNVGGRPGIDPTGKVRLLIGKLEGQGIKQAHIPNSPDVINKVADHYKNGKHTEMLRPEITKLSDDKYKGEFGFSRSPLVKIAREVYT